MELLTEVPQTGTQLRIDADRQFEGKPGDSTLRVVGERDGTNVFDATYVEVDPQSAYLIHWLLRSLRQPAPELLEKMSQEIQSVFKSKLSGRDAAQAAEIAWQAIREQSQMMLGVPHQQTTTGGQPDFTKLEQIAERFDRAASRAKQPYGGSVQNQGEHYQSSGQQHQGQQSVGSRSSRN